MLRAGVVLEPPQDEAYESFARMGREGRIIAKGTPGARFLLKIAPERLYVLADGEPQGQHLVAAFREAVASGMPRGIKTLTDVRHFTGIVDWDSVRGLRELAPNFGGIHTSVAYVVRDNLFGHLIKIAAAMFPKVQHKVFLDPAEAEAWLDSV